MTGSAIPMILTCPCCGARHIDEGEFTLKLHHTHACQHCGMVWRPAIGPTVGVQFLPGFKNATSTEEVRAGLLAVAAAEQLRHVSEADKCDYSNAHALLAKERVEALALVDTRTTERDAARIEARRLRNVALGTAGYLEADADDRTRRSWAAGVRREIDAPRSLLDAETEELRPARETSAKALARLTLEVERLTIERDAARAELSIELDRQQRSGHFDAHGVWMPDPKDPSPVEPGTR